jgi:hypothetical protein
VLVYSDFQTSFVVVECEAKDCRGYARRRYLGNSPTGSRAEGRIGRNG